MLTDLHQWSTIVALSLACAAITITITKARIFEEFRESIIRKSEWAGNLVSCSYCLSHWIAGILTILYRPNVLAGGVLVIDMAITMFIIVCISTLFTGQILKSIPFRTGPSIMDNEREDDDK